jgi:hypothetical protein
MRSAVSVRSLTLLGLILLSVMVLLPGSPRAQDELPASMDKLGSKWDEVKKRFFQLRDGEELAKADNAVVQGAARYYVYRLTVPTEQAKAGAMLKILTEFEGVAKFLSSSKDARTAKFRSLFTKELLGCIRQVLALDVQQNQMAVINAGLMLAPLARTGDEDVGDYLAGLVKGAKNDVVRLFAFKGLQEYFQARAAADPVRVPGVDALADDAVRMKEVRRIEPIIEFVTQTASPPDVDAYRFLRREAIRALAETRVPGIPLLPKLDGTMHAAVPHALLRVLTNGKDALTPPASLSEKYEAALGLCRTRAKLLPRYKPELAIALVGQFLVDYCKVYTKDADHFGKATFIPLLPWRANAEQLKEAMKDFAANAPDGNAVKQVELMKANTASIFTSMRNGKAVEPRVLETQVENLPRPNPAVYQKAPAYQIEIGEWPVRGG